MSVNDIAIQSQPLLNVKDSNKVGIWRSFFSVMVFFTPAEQCLTLQCIFSFFFFFFFFLQEDRERIVVRRFKFEELRLEQIQDLEVCWYILS